MKILLIVLIMLLTACTKVGKDKEILPFKVRLMDSATVFDSRTITTGRPFVVIYFKTDCKLCQREADDLMKNMDSLQNVDFYFISVDTYERLNVFKRVYKTDKFPNVLLAQDNNDEFVDSYSPNISPYVLLFDRRKILRFVYPGGIPSDKLITAIKSII
jgi:thiol-disulfide isomerase/thioredoxin